jgi:hypothetical protein
MAQEVCNFRRPELSRLSENAALRIRVKGHEPFTADAWPKW